MPQKVFPLTVAGEDTTYTIYSTDELWQVPDSVLSQQTKEYYYELAQKVINETQQVKEDYRDNFGWVPFISILFVVLILYITKTGSPEEEEEQEDKNENNQSYHLPAYHKYEGSALNFTDADLHSICEKYNPFYNKLNAGKKMLFLERIRHFMIYKNFYIVGDKPYREMPVLLSAAAIQISFGLEEYQFPHFSGIVIHPEEYIAYEPLRILVGNVQGKNISISWKHFLEDYKNATDGKNVGLHEMAHALQVQYLFQDHKYSKSFQEDYAFYDKIDDGVQAAEKSSSARLFDDNALRNSDEFWATSVELFFERPQQLQKQYPELYDSIAVILNQDTAKLG